ncbi:MAG: tRNA1(Val) (adenine(37)-N6)-methyltransferase [Desulfobacteraceae bacterium]|nr:MAG: tRNA1(Val) (adenine(37)-N6)-methyltransferase [Desulfobacteraceae bacterium]
MAELTRDTFFDGRLIVTQPRDGYRFSIDAILLAAAVAPQRGNSILDLGTGSGIIPLILALRHPDVHISAVEIQPELAGIAVRNVDENQSRLQITVVHADMRSLPNNEIKGPFDWVISNPPYRSPHSGRINPNRQRALARHEITIDLPEVLACAKRMLRTGGQFGTIYPAERAIELADQMRRADIEPKQIRTVHSHSGQDARLVLVQGIKGGRAGLRIAAPLVVYQPGGDYTEAVQAMMKP